MDVDINAPRLMINPPIVGTPALDLCNCASSLTCSFVRKTCFMCRDFNDFIKNGPQIVQMRNEMSAASIPSRNTLESKVVKLPANVTNMYTKHMYYSFGTCEGKLIPHAYTAATKIKMKI